jgi:uncharacterized protein YciI
MKVVNFATYTDNWDVAMQRPAHREYVAQLESEGKLVAGGPFKDGTGALFIYNVDSVQEAQAIVAADPYSRGAFASCELRDWEVVIAVSDLLRPSAG